MVITSVTDLILYFFLYSMVGWVCECIYCSIPARRFINRGFMFGPYCPIYGTGAVVILLIGSQFYYNPVLMFLVAMLLTTIVEYIAGWLMETLFQMKWWDYSKKRFQLHGRVCLKNSLLFGLMSVVLVYFVHLPVRDLFYGLSYRLKNIMVLTMAVLWIVDIMMTLQSLSRMKAWLAKAQSFMEELRQHDKIYEWFERKEIQGSLPRLREFLEIQSHSVQDRRPVQALQKQLEQLMDRRRGGSRLLEAFPELKPKGMERAMKMLRDNWKIRK